MHNQMKILITGGTGLLGKALIETNKDPHLIWAVYLGKYKVADSKCARYFNADICEKDSLAKVFDEAKADIVIHTAGIANVDYCEKNYDRARYSNVDGTANVIELCKKYGSKIIFVSTNAVFDGRNPPYSEEDVPSPVNQYGRMKLECEKMVMKSALRYAIVRPILMYGWNNENERTNLVTWLLRKLRAGESVNMVNDVYENPVFDLSCAEIIWKLIKLNKVGIYHISGRDTVNRYEFALSIADVFGLDKILIKPVVNSFFRDIAPRPPNTSYDTKKIERELGVKPIGITEGLSLMKSPGAERTACRK